MDSKVITIFYAADDPGPAELIGDKLARIVDVPLVSAVLWRDDIVRLTHLPGEADGYPKIEEVVFRRFSRLRFLRIHQMHEAYVLSGVLASLKADSAIVLPPKFDMQGMMLVAFNPPLDPIGLAEAIGIDQTDRDDGDEPEDADVDEGSANEAVHEEPPAPTQGAAG
jgi:hypothetical protein